MRLRLSENRLLSRLDGRMYRRLGENIYLIISIMAVLFVFSGLVVGLLGRGWAVAWFLVFLGVTLGFLPILHFLIEWEKRHPVDIGADEEDLEETDDADREEVVDDQTRQALEREARLARAEIKRRNEAKRQEEKLRRQEERILRQAREKEYERRRQEEERKKKPGIASKMIKWLNELTKPEEE